VRAEEQEVVQRAAERDKAEERDKAAALARVVRAWEGEQRPAVVRRLAVVPRQAVVPERAAEIRPT
jgi:hypothetical protein